MKSLAGGAIAGGAIGGLVLAVGITGTAGFVLALAVVTIAVGAVSYVNSH